jgi:hypothetical protein
MTASTISPALGLLLAHINESTEVLFVIRAGQVWIPARGTKLFMSHAPIKFGIFA